MKNRRVQHCEISLAAHGAFQDVESAFPITSVSHGYYHDRHVNAVCRGISGANTCCEVVVVAVEERINVVMDDFADLWDSVLFVSDQRAIGVSEVLLAILERESAVAIVVWTGLR